MTIKSFLNCCTIPNARIIIQTRFLLEPLFDSKKHGKVPPQFDQITVYSFFYNDKENSYTITV